MAERPLTQEMLDRRSYGQGSRARFDPQWAMSRPEKWYTQSYDTGKSKIRNIDLIKDTLVRQPAVTTDQDESRNMYQMLMNQMKGGDRGARLIDTSGLPAGARRIGRTLFTDPAKSQGFFGDVESLFTGRNKAAVRAKEYNPFPKAGFGADWYKKQFPIASGLGSLMEAAENFMPGLGMAKRMLSKERTPLERDPSFLPENNMAPFWELLEDEVIGETPLGAVDKDAEWSMIHPIEDVSIEDITETITEDDGEKFVLKEAQFDLGNLGVGTEYSPSVDLNIMNIKDSELRKKATEAALMFHQAYTEGEGGKYYGQLEEFWQAYMDAVEAGAKPSLEDITSQIEDINLQLDDSLEDQADLLNRIEALKNENRANNMLFDI